jgi:hypothetical protein
MFFLNFYHQPMMPAAVEMERPARGKMPPSIEAIAPGILKWGLPVE